MPMGRRRSRCLGSADVANAKVQQEVHVISDDEASSKSSEMVFNAVGSKVYEKDSCKQLKRNLEDAADTVNKKERKNAGTQASLSPQPHQLPEEAEIIELSSISSNNRNTQLKSNESSSDFAVSTSDKAARQRTALKKNTLTESNLMQMFDNLDRVYPQLTYKEKIDAWECSSQVSELDDVKWYREVDTTPPTPALPTRRTRQSVKTAMRSGLCPGSEDDSKPVLNSVWSVSDESSIFTRNRQNPEIDKARRLQLNGNVQKKPIEEFKVPNPPPRSLQPVAELNKERFCNILGLETKIESRWSADRLFKSSHSYHQCNPKIKIISSFSYSECNSTTTPASTLTKSPTAPERIGLLHTNTVESPCKARHRKRYHSPPPPKQYQHLLQKPIRIVARVDYKKEEPKSAPNLPDVVPREEEQEPETQESLESEPSLTVQEETHSKHEENEEEKEVQVEEEAEEQTKPAEQTSKPKRKRKKSVWSKRKMKIFRSSNLNQKILRNRKVIKIIANRRPLVVKKRPRHKSESDKSVNLFSAAKKVNGTLTPIPAPPPTKDTNPFELRALNTTSFPTNPLKFENGEVLYAFYENEVLIVVQTLAISFWKYCKMVKVWGGSAEWIFLNECNRKLEDEEIPTPYKNRLCAHESTTIYVEMRGRELVNEKRECHLTCVYVNVYYFDKDTDKAVTHSINLDSVKCLPSEITYTTIPESRYFVMCWKQEAALGKSRTGLCKYSLTPDLETLASIREFKQMRHAINYLDCINDDKLIGFGETQITVWDVRTGDVLVNFDLEMNLGTNLSSIFYNSDNDDIDNSLLLFQLCTNESQTEHEDASVHQPQELKIFTISVSQTSSSYRLIYSHELPSSFQTLKSFVNTGDYVILASAVNEEVWIACDEPKCLTYFNRPNTKRFYTNLNSKFIEITEDNLIVETLLNQLLKFVK